MKSLSCLLFAILLNTNRADLNRNRGGGDEGPVGNESLDESASNSLLPKQQMVIPPISNV